MGNDNLSAEEQQRRSFALGNVRMENRAVTKEHVDRAAEALSTTVLPADAADAFRALSDAVREAVGMEGYIDAHQTETDEAASGLREAWLAFLAVPAVRTALGPVADEASKAIEEDDAKCNNCGVVDCESEECEAE